MELSANIVTNWKPLTIFEKISILDLQSIENRGALRIIYDTLCDLVPFVQF